MVYDSDEHPYIPLQDFHERAFREIAMIFLFSLLLLHTGVIRQRAVGKEA
jgi:hypothetical protein